MADEEETIRLRTLDAGIAFRADGNIELVLGDQEAAIIPGNIRWALAVMYALKDEELSELIEQHFDKECRRLKLQSKIADEEQALTASQSEKNGVQALRKEAESNLIHFSRYKK